MPLNRCQFFDDDGPQSWMLVNTWGLVHASLGEAEMANKAADLMREGANIIENGKKSKAMATGILKELEKTDAPAKKKARTNLQLCGVCFVCRYV